MVVARGKDALLARTGWLTVLVLASLLAGCGRQKTARGDTVQPEARSLATPGEQVSATPGPSDRFSEPAFDLNLRAVGEYRTGQLGRVEAWLDSKAPYKVNAEFPLTLRTRPASDIRYLHPVVGKEQARLEDRRAIVPVEFTPTASGEKWVGGTLRFSVCNDQRCLVEKRELALKIEVK